MAVAFTVALGATYSAFRSATLRREATARKRWSDFYLVLLGRTTRRGLWLGLVAPFLGMILLALVWASPFEAPWPTFALIGAWLWPAIAIGAKRCHDRDKPGWFLLIFVIPVLGTLWLLIELGFFRGTVGPIGFGPDPSISN